MALFMSSASCAVLFSAPLIYSLNPPTPVDSRTQTIRCHEEVSISGVRITELEVTHDEVPSPSHTKTHCVDNCPVPKHSAFAVEPEGVYQEATVNAPVPKAKIELPDMLYWTELLASKTILVLLNNCPFWINAL